MPTWKKVIVSGSIAQLNQVTASFKGDGSGLTNVTATAVFPTTAKTDLATTDQIYINDGANKYVTYGNLVTDLAGSGQATSNLTTTDTGDSLALTSQITITGASGSFSGSHFGSYTGNGSGLTSIPYTSLTSVPSGIVSASSLASSTQGQVTLTTNGVGVTTNLNSLQAADSPTFANVNANAASFGLATSTATAIQIGGSSATVTVPGNLTVNGTTSIINTTILEVKDPFILLGSGSVSAATDGGIIVQGATQGTGSAFYWDGGENRWSVANTIASTLSGGITSPNSYVVTVSGSSINGATPGGPYYGAADTSRIGNMFVDTGLSGVTDNNIWIWA